jgi:hypothetical protein
MSQVDCMLDSRILGASKNNKYNLAILFVLLILVIPSCGLRDEEYKSELQTLNFQPLYRIALSEATYWSEDAYLVEASLPIWVGNDPESTTSTFGFHSSSDRTKWLLVRILPNGSSASNVEIFEGVYEEERPPASNYRISDEILGSTGALEIISNNGGARFMHRYGDSAESYLVLEYSQNHFESLPLEWVGHFHLPGQSPGLIIEINAHTGDVLKIYDPTN